MASVKSFKAIDVLKNPALVTQEAVVFLCGQERFLVDALIRRLRDEVLGAVNAFNYETIDAENLSGAQLADRALEKPFGAAKKMLLVNGCDRWSASEYEAFSAYLDQPNEASFVLMVGGEGFDARRKFFKELLKKGKIVEAETPKGPEAIPYLVNFAKKRGHTFGPGVAEQIANLSGDSLLLLEQAVEKLSLLVGAQERIEMDDVRALLADTREGIIWNLTDALATGRNDQAFLSLRRMLREKNTATALQMIGALSGFFRRLLGLRAGDQLGKTDGEMAGALGLSPGAIYMNRKWTKTFTRKQLLHGLELISQADRKLKSTGLGSELILNELIANLLALRALPAKAARTSY